MHGTCADKHNTQSQTFSRVDRAGDRAWLSACWWHAGTRRRCDVPKSWENTCKLHARTSRAIWCVCFVCARSFAASSMGRSMLNDAQLKEDEPTDSKRTTTTTKTTRIFGIVCIVYFAQYNLTFVLCSCTYILRASHPQFDDAVFDALAQWLGSNITWMCICRGTLTNFDNLYTETCFDRAFFRVWLCHFIQLSMVWLINCMNRFGGILNEPQIVEIENPVSIDTHCNALGF